MEEKQFEVSFDMRNKLALQMLHVTLPPDFVDKINNFIDGKVENLDVIRQNSDSKYPPGIDLDIGLTEDNQDVKLLKSTLDTICGEYLRQIGHGDSHVDVFESWSILSYAGDYNPLHDHGVLTPGGLSMILYMKVPECISKLPDPDDKDGKIWFNDHSGDIDGFTYFIWDNRNQDMLRKLYPVAEEYFKPKVGTLLIFPNWLKHAVMPFFGEGERRTLAANANIISPEMFNWKDASEEEREKLLTTLRNSRYRYGGGGGGLGEKKKN